MKVARVYGAGDLRVSEEPEPTRGVGESLVRVRAVGLCGSDLHWFGEGGIGDARVTDPLVLGHEFAGEAIDGPHAGRLVAVDPAIACGRCELCRQGHPNLCESIRFAGHGLTDGGLKEVVSWPTELLHPLPDGFTAADGALLEPLGVALHSWDLAHARVGQVVSVVGCGPIGLLTIQLAMAAGAERVIAVEPLAHRRDAALRAGAVEAIHPDEARDAARWHELTAGLGAHLAFEVAGNDDALDIAMTSARPGGKVILTGIPDDDHVGFRASQARRKGLTVLLVRRMKEMYPRTIALTASGRVNLDELVTDVFGIGDAERAFTSAIARTGLKVVVDPGL